MLCPHWNDETKLSEQPPNRVDSCGSCRHPARPNPVQGGQLLLRHRLDRNRPDVAVADRLEQPLHIRAVGLVPLHGKAERTGARSESPRAPACQSPVPNSATNRRLPSPLSTATDRRSTSETSPDSTDTSSQHVRDGLKSQPQKHSLPDPLQSSYPSSRTPSC